MLLTLLSVATGGKIAMWHKPFLFMALGVLLALSTTVNTMVASLVNPILAAVTGGKGVYS